jgi:hypothetical protein
VTFYAFIFTVRWTKLHNIISLKLRKKSTVTLFTKNNTGHLKWNVKIEYLAKHWYEITTQRRVKSETRADFKYFARFVSPSNLCLIP